MKMYGVCIWRVEATTTMAAGAAAAATKRNPNNMEKKKRRNITVKWRALNYFLQFDIWSATQFHTWATSEDFCQYYFELAVYYISHWNECYLEHNIFTVFVYESYWITNLWDFFCLLVWCASIWFFLFFVQLYASFRIMYCWEKFFLCRDFSFV